MCGDVFNTGVGARPWYSNPISRIIGDIFNTPNQIIAGAQSLVTDVSRWVRGEINMHIDNPILNPGIQPGHDAAGNNPPAPTPTPTPVPETPAPIVEQPPEELPGPIAEPSTDPNDPNYVGDPNATLTASQRRKRLAALRTGLGATIKTGPLGIGTAAQTMSPIVTATGLKTKLGA